MPFCPKCKAEYEVGVSKCSDCDIPLMVQLPEEKDEPVPEADLVPVINVTDESEAVFYCDLLRQAGINATFRSFTVPGYPMVSEQIAHWGEVLVLDDDAEQADQIIVDYLKTLETQEIEETPEEEV
ncbi:MAG: hypothetical protein QME64_00835 [bacterium]|nr:hypothetical protein [bacterium]